MPVSTSSDSPEFVVAHAKFSSTRPSHLLTSIISFLVAAIIAAVSSPPLSAAPVDGNFTTDVIDSGAGKTKIEFDHAGRLYLTEKRGRLLRLAPNGSGGFESPVVMLDIQSQVNFGGMQQA